MIVGFYPPALPVCVNNNMSQVCHLVLGVTGMSRDVTNLSPICHGSVTDLSPDVTNLSQICHKSVTGCRAGPSPACHCSLDVTNMCSHICHGMSQVYHQMLWRVCAHLLTPPVTLIVGRRPPPPRPLLDFIDVVGAVEACRRWWWRGDVVFCSGGSGGAPLAAAAAADTALKAVDTH